MKYAIVGYGRMGRAIEERANARGHSLVACLDGGSIDPSGLADAAVAFEFTRGEAARDNVLAALRAGVNVVCGTTGWTPSDSLDATARQGGAALMVAPNFSLGMNLFLSLAGRAARAVAAIGEHEPFVQEAHHRGKRDAPSGTATRLVEILRAADTRAREVDVACTRAGHEPGTHVVGFDGPHDRITLRHEARGREGFALGAVLAAEWLGGKVGRYPFEDTVRDIVSGEFRIAGPGGAS